MVVKFKKMLYNISDIIMIAMELIVHEYDGSLY